MLQTYLINEQVTKGPSQNNHWTSKNCINVLSESWLLLIGQYNTEHPYYSNRAVGEHH